MRPAKELRPLADLICKCPHIMNLVPSDLPMQQDVLSIFMYFNDRIAPAEVRVQMGKADGHLDRCSARQIKLSISVSPTSSQTQTRYRFGLTA